MRDHPHHDIGVLGGTWGIKLSNPTIRKQYGDSFKLMLRDPIASSKRDIHGPDQTALTKYIW